NGEGLITETLDVGKKEEKGDNVYARLEGERAVVKIPASAIDPIRKVIERPNSLRDHNLLSFAAQTADGIDVKLPGEDKPIELRKVGEPPQWKLYDSAGPADLRQARQGPALRPPRRRHNQDRRGRAGDAARQGDEGTARLRGPGAAVVRQRRHHQDHLPARRRDVRHREAEEGRQVAGGLADRAAGRPQRPQRRPGQGPADPRRPERTDGPEALGREGQRPRAGALRPEAAEGAGD